MKKQTGVFSCVFLLVMVLSHSLSAQTLKDLFNATETPLTWLGVDFTQVKVLNDPTGTPSGIKEQFNKINQLILNEPRKYAVDLAFNKPDIAKDIRFTTAKNETTDPENIIGSGSDDVRFKKATIESIVKGYDFEDKKGLGIMFIAETLNKASVTGAFYVTIIDMGTKKVLLTERMTGKPAGFGFRNYWAKTIYEILLQIERGKYSEWKAANG